MGRPQPSPLIQLTANSEDQVLNMYRPLKAMVLLGSLKERLRVREGFIRVLNGDSDVSDAADLDRIDTVSYTHLTLPTTARRCRSRWSPYH